MAGPLVPTFRTAPRRDLYWVPRGLPNLFSVSFSEVPFSQCRMKALGVDVISFPSSNGELQFHPITSIASLPEHQYDTSQAGGS